MENIPHGPRASFDDELSNIVAEQFNIGTITATKDLGGTYNLNVLLETMLDTYVMRVYRPWVTYERLTMLHHVKQELHRNALPIASKIGETIFSYQDRYVEVEYFIPHDSVTETWQHYEIAFSLLAKLHTCFATKLQHVHIVPPLVAIMTYLMYSLLRRYGQRKESGKVQIMKIHNWPLPCVLTPCNYLQEYKRGGTEQDIDYHNK